MPCLTPMSLKEGKTMPTLTTIVACIRENALVASTGSSSGCSEPMSHQNVKRDELS